MVSVWLFFLTCWCASASASSAQFYPLEQAWELFEEFVTKFEKNYASDVEKQLRFEVFKSNLERVNSYNEENELAVHGVTKFMDLSPEEFIAKFTSVRDKDSLDLADFDQCSTVKYDHDILIGDTPESIDWRNKNAVTRVKDQKLCGGCYAFSSVGHLESQYFLKHKKLVEFSEQQIIDCTTIPFLGCLGGRMSSAFKGLKGLGGPMKEADYPYLGFGWLCQSQISKVVVNVTGCVSYNLTQQRTMQQLLNDVGPLPIALRADNLQTYHKGIIKDGKCGNGTVNHAVLLVGYGTENNTNYWLVKNSWGTNWGEHGYFRMQRSDTGDACGMMNPFLATVNLD